MDSLGSKIASLNTNIGLEGIIYFTPFYRRNQIMRISTEAKQSLVARYRAGESVVEICADSGVPRSTFYTWIKPYTVTVSGYTVSHQEFIKMKQKLQKLPESWHPLE